VAGRTQAQHTSASPGIPQSCTVLKPQLCPRHRKRTRTEEHEPAERYVWQGLQERCQSHLRHGNQHRRGQAHIRLNRELCSHFKLNWTLGTCAKMFGRLLLAVPACSATSEENEQCSCSLLAVFSRHRGWGGLFTPLHKHRAGTGSVTGSVTIASTQALVYTLLAALSLYGIFN